MHRHECMHQDKVYEHVWTVTISKCTFLTSTASLPAFVLCNYNGNTLSAKDTLI